MNHPHSGSDVKAQVEGLIGKLETTDVPLPLPKLPESHVSENCYSNCVLWEQSESMMQWH